MTIENNGGQSADEIRAGELFDLLPMHPDGMTADEVAIAKDWSSSQFTAAVQKVRDICSASGDSISVVAEPQGQGQPWLYSLIAGNLILDPEQSQWLIIRFKDATRRLKTIRSVLTVCVAATNGRTSIGKKAKIYLLHLTRAEEEVLLLGNEDGLPD